MQTRTSSDVSPVDVKSLLGARARTAPKGARLQRGNPNAPAAKHRAKVTASLLTRIEVDACTQRNKPSPSPTLQPSRRWLPRG